MEMMLVRGVSPHSSAGDWGSTEIMVRFVTLRPHLVFWSRRRIVTVKGAEVKLTPREYDLLRLLIAHAGKVLTHKFILKEVWGGETDVQYLRIYVRTLRQKLEADPEQPGLILTEQGVGYRLRAADS